MSKPTYRPYDKMKLYDTSQKYPSVYWPDVHSYVYSEYGNKAPKPYEKQTVYVQCKLQDVYNWNTKKVAEATKSFSEMSLIPEEMITFDLGYESGYYDSVDVYVEFRGIRLETDEEYERRLEELRLKEEAKKEAAKKSALKKAEQDKAEYERLKKKFEGK